MLGETQSARCAVTALLAQLEARVVDWAAVRARILAAATVVSGGPPRAGGLPAAVLVVEHEHPSPSWLFESGLAVGALGGRAIVAQLGDEPPPPALRDLGVIRLNPDEPASLHALAERLRRISALAP